jgi:hypothetical protein
VIQGVGIVAPGLPDWERGRPALAGEQAYEPTPLGRVRAATLPRLEARRATDTVHLAVAAAEQAVAPGQGGDVPTVFASADGDLETAERICRSVAEPEPWISPHRFHNSVHNAPSGYWSIAAGWRGPSTTLAAGAASFGTGLIEALLTVVTERAEQCLLVVYDDAAPPAFRSVNPVEAPFAVALLLARTGRGPHVRTDGRGYGDTPSACEAPALEALRQQNPAARALPLLAALAGDRSASLGLPGPGGTLRLVLDTAP